MKTKSSGFVAVLVVLFFALVMGVLLVLLVDLGRAYVVRTQLRNVSDAASLAALNAYTGYTCTGTPQQCANPRWVQEQRVLAAYNAAQATADHNLVMGIQGPRPGGGLSLGSAQGIILGSYNEATKTFTPAPNPNDPQAVINAARVAARLGAHRNPLLSGIFTGLIGQPGAAGALSAEAISSSEAEYSLQPYDVVIVLDATGSMKWPFDDSVPSRWALSRLAALRFVEFLKARQGNRPTDKRDRVGLVLFNDAYLTPSSGISGNVRGLTTNLDAVINILNAYPRVNDVPDVYRLLGLRRPDHICEADTKECGKRKHSAIHYGTNLEMPLARAFCMLDWTNDWENPNRSDGRQRMIVFLTDGVPYTGYCRDSNVRFPNCSAPNAVPHSDPSRHSRHYCCPCSKSGGDRRVIVERDEKLRTWGSGGSSRGIILHTIGLGDELMGEGIVLMRRLAGSYDKGPDRGKAYFADVNPASIFQEIGNGIIKKKKGHRLVK